MLSSLMITWSNDRVFSPQPSARMKAFCHGLMVVASARWQARMQCNSCTQVEELVMGHQLVARCTSCGFFRIKVVR